MKKNITTLCISLLIATVSFSQNIYPKILQDSLVVITKLQLKQTNLIFSEHKKQKLQIKEYENIVLTYDSLSKNNNELISSLSQKNEFLNKDLTLCRDLINEQNALINKQKRRVKILKGVSIGGVVISGTLLLILLVK